ncbi:DUF2786 domain-containing protein [Anaerorhabdus sp.]|uniref:DUF2786 domain-containing protein n=1 Tax=Anaerorhabdus sp. TaxID=1872524 RepID=UPI002FC7557D
MNENILIRIQKLLNVADRGTPNEQKIAMMKAQKLMLDYRIELADLHGVSVEKVVSLRCAEEVNSYVKWIDDLTRIICKNFRCRPLYFRPKKRKGKFTRTTVCGLEQDAQICKSVLEYAVKVAQCDCKRVINQMQYLGDSPTKGYKNTFMNGFNEGIKEGFYQQILKNNLYAVAEVVPEEVNNYVNTLDKVKLPYNSQKAVEDFIVHDMGYQKGIEFVHDMNNAKGLEIKGSIENI